MKKLTEQLQEILGVNYVAPHASPDGVRFEVPRRCGDCFCTIQEVHTHGNEEDYKKVLQAVKERDEFIIGDDEDDNVDENEDWFDINVRNKLRGEQHARADESLSSK